MITAQAEERNNGHYHWLQFST